MGFFGDYIEYVEFEDVLVENVVFVEVFKCIRLVGFSGRGDK